LSPEGGIRFNGAAATLYAELDAEFERLALDAGARAVVVEPVIARHTLERAGFFEAFTGRAVPADDPDAVLAPAACYHVYDRLAGQRLEHGSLTTVASPCGRREAREATDASRLERFRMREIVFVGEASWVSRQRDEWMGRVQRVASDRGLATALEPATDTFFGDPGRGRRLIQQLKQLKFELRADAGAFGRLAIASFNLHESFFTSRFDIVMADGSPAVSGCVAFGLERWTLACLAALG
jgi:seryl-tRNA synthetase